MKWVTKNGESIKNYNMKGTIDRILAQKDLEDKKARLVNLARKMDKGKVSLLVSSNLIVRVPPDMVRTRKDLKKTLKLLKQKYGV